ncbi:hypothetical protein [Enterococcus faecium]|uniref:hypothetical protein n=1 Tax=Enterococcus faecium TaxID=1352 RepID=UPI00145AF069|nr:hypothetical protein [Enterococcus faecium]QMX56540.1 hypothetical protein HI838_014925 [Enterococcus faecium]QOJ75696.1 hypothetical protein IG632_14925 [Enterococcus faecium]QTQ92100.1 hypothetical protein J7155_14895 [Enterococcus faecium]HCR2865836.1 hypothetical protein [Enterococcus faecium]
MEKEEREVFIKVLNTSAKQKISESLKVIKDLELGNLNIDNTIEVTKKFKYKEFKYKLDLTKDIDNLAESIRLIDLAYTDNLNYLFDCYIAEINYSRFIKNNLESLIEAELPEFKGALTAELKDYLTVLDLSDYFVSLKETKIDTITAKDIANAMKQMVEEEMVAEYQSFELNLDLIKFNIFRKIRHIYRGN